MEIKNRVSIVLIPKICISGFWEIRLSGFSFFTGLINNEKYGDRRMVEGCCLGVYQWVLFFPCRWFGLDIPSF